MSARAAPGTSSEDEPYLNLLLDAIAVCARYEPKFGQGNRGVSKEEFQALYGGDPFYKWMGIDSPLMYAAHKAAGGMTSIYRQIGKGCERIFIRLLQDRLGLTLDEASWTYEMPVEGGRTRKLELDGRIELESVRNDEARRRVSDWLGAVGEKLRLEDEMRESVKGVVFETRQGYKSKDSKRQNADIANAANAYASLYVPVLLVLSTQIDSDIALRYSQARWLLLTGTTGGTPTDSTYVFAREVLGYDLAAFLERNSDRIRAELEAVLERLLSA